MMATTIEYTIPHKKYIMEEVKDVIGGMSERTVHNYVRKGLLFKHCITSGNVIYSLSTELEDKLQ